MMRCFMEGNYFVMVEVDSILQNKIKIKEEDEEIKSCVDVNCEILRRRREGRKGLVLLEE
jgi:hypothetical protein